MWISASSNKAGALVFDLGQAHSLDTIAIWNFSADESISYLQRGVKSYSLEYSVDGLNYNPLLGLSELPKGTGSSTLPPSASLSFTDTDARFVRLNISNHWVMRVSHA